MKTQAQRVVQIQLYLLFPIRLRKAYGVASERNGGSCIGDAYPRIDANNPTGRHSPSTFASREGGSGLIDRKAEISYGMKMLTSISINAASLALLTPKLDLYL